MVRDPMATSWLVNFLTKHWLVILVIGAFYVFMSVRVAVQMGKLGRSTARWLFITLFFTAIPAGVVLLWHNFGWLIRSQRYPDDVPDETKGQDR